MARNFFGAGYGNTNTSAVLRQTGGNPYTVDCWINVTSFPSSGTYIGIVNTTDATFAPHEFPVAMGLIGPQEVKLQSTGTSAANFEITNAISGWTTGTWHHLAGIADGSSNYTVYFDGVAQSNASGTPGPTLSSSYNDLVYIAAYGGSFPGSGELDGSLQNVTLRLNTVLTQNELNALVRGIQPWHIRPRTISGCWPLMVLDQDAAHIEVDFSGNNNGLFMNGTNSIVPGPPVDFYTSHHP